ncbi:MAG: glycosyltransferase family 4 protein [Christensenellaceae bacterium]|jgi:glycosyltransferase involved in cell wall biosynthesis
MKIAFLAAAGSPRTIKWANAMIKRGHEVSVFSLPEHKDQHQELSDQVVVTYLPHTEAEGGLKKNVKALKEYMGAGYDVINAIDAQTYGFLAVKTKLDRVVLTLTGKDVYTCAQNGKKGFVVKSLKHAQAAIVCAPNVQTQAEAVFKKEKKYFTVPFGVDTQHFVKKDKKKDDTLTFGSLKLLNEGCGVDLVIEAFARFIENTGTEAKLLIAGSGEMEQKLQTKVQNMGISDKVKFLGYIVNEKMPDTIGKMDIVVRMNEMESFGVDGIEAMACEKPFISSDTVGASEYILNSVTGFMVRAGNTKACADIMEKLAKDETLRAEMGQKARGDVEEHYELSKCAAKYEDALKTVAG